MLKQLEVWCFRQHRYAKFDFTDGLNVIRGANESGKSTIIEALTYALFGISACREPLAQVVTWGEPETSLKVKLAIAIDGTEYVITRKKSGAELNAEGLKVVGQTEVANKIGRLFGCSTKNVNRLVLAGQGNIRGALSEGSAKTSALIEELANFAIIDEILKLIDLRLVTGPTKMWEEKIVALAEQLEPLERALIAPDTEADEAILTALRMQTAACQTEVDAITTMIGPLASKRDALHVRAEEWARLHERAKLLREQRHDAAEAVAKALATAPKAADLKRANEIRALLNNHEETERRLQGRLVLDSLKYPSVFWEGDLDDFRAALKLAYAERAEAIDRNARIEADIRVKTAERVAAANCSYCGQDFSQIPAVAEKNAAIKNELIGFKVELEGVRAAIQRGSELIDRLHALETLHNAIQQKLAPYARDVQWDTNCVPHKPRWAFHAVQGVLNPAELRDELRAIEAQHTASMEHGARCKSLAEAQDRAAAQVVDLEVKLISGFTDLEELPALEAKCQELNDGYSKIYSALVAAQTETAEVQARVTAAKQAFEVAKARVESVRAAKAEAEEAVKTVGFNNALKARIQKARPIIANKLWSKVLAAVSRYFTQMRGEESVVTKDVDGFKVNGKPIEGLSGSTLDILGLAIRLALVRTFLPHTPLLILDEPSAACDAPRTEAMMGFLVSCGFDQMLLVTHEDMSERVAENLITL